MTGSSQRFYFLHIPKTAGITFTYSVLHQMFEPADICRAYSYRELLKIDPAQRSTYRLFSGHFYYPARRVLPAPLAHMTFLRNPLDRVVSLYEYVLREPGHYQHDLVQSLKGGLEEFAQSPDLLVPNFQIIALAADVDVEAAISRAGGEVDEDIVILDEMRRAPVTREDLKLACARLEEFPFVGITERFQESVELLCATFNWPAVRYESLNVAPRESRRPERITADVRREVAKSHELEWELYEFAKELFSRRLAERRNAVFA